VAERGVEPVPVDDVLATPADVVAPCALGGVLTRASADALACEIVCGGANNQLATVEIDDALAARGVLYAPDFVANAGGILNIAEEFVGYSRPRALEAARGIEATMTGVFAAARTWGVAPGRAADRIARERIAHEPFGSGRWEPGDPTAWTDGAPLRSLRPGGQTTDATT
jgi:glutamate dehydrogenase/leucine dehydrogenase